MAKGKEKPKPLTREDVLKLIEENGGKTEGLDLSERKFEEGINLSGLDLSGIELEKARLFRANFNGSILDRASMKEADLQYATFNPSREKVASLKFISFNGAHLNYAQFREADLELAQFQSITSSDIQTVAVADKFRLPAFLDNTDFRGANLFRANFKGCYFYGTKLEGASIRGADILEAHLEEADWGNYAIGEEIRKDFYSAESIYRRLKIWYTNVGIFDIAGEFFFRQMTAKRKMLKWWPNPFHRALSKSLSLLLGYGERPSRVVISAIVIIFGLAVAYVFGGMSLPYSIYFSAVSFTALGYGSWAYTPPENWVQGVGAFESFLGVLMVVLFSITFVRKMTR